MPRKESAVYQCDNCLYKSSRRRYLITHLRLDGKFICDQCGFETAESSGMGKHSLLHMEVIKVTCDKCKEVLSSRQCLMVHIAHIHGRKKEVYSCDECDVKSKQKGVIKRHWLKKHFKFIPKEIKACDLCGNQFSNLLQHFQYMHSETIEYHRPIISLKCDNCNKTFSCRSNLLQHWKEVHCGTTRRNGTKNYYCDICLHRSGRMFDLAKHIFANHDSSKTVKFKCIVCSASFCREKGLKTHTRSIHYSS